MSFADFNIHLPHNASGVNVRTTCPQCSSMRRKTGDKCLSVNVDDSTFFCHHCSWSGSAKTKNDYPKPMKKVYVKPTAPKTDLTEGIFSFFKKRGISREVLERNKVGAEMTYMPNEGKEVMSIAFPFYENGEVVNIKYRDLNKNFKQVKDARKVFYGIDDVTENDMIVVEGEMDKLSLEMAGYTSCVSVPDGAPPANAKSYETKFDFMGESQAVTGSLKKIIIAVDSDGPGQKLEEELVRRFGPERCWRVTWPEGCKDANDVLIKNGANELALCIETAKPIPVSGIFEINDISKDIDELYENGMQGGASTGWWGVSNFYTVRPGEWTVVTGVPSHGKALDIDTPISTINGFVPMKDIKVGNIVFDEKGNRCNVVNVTEVMYGRPCYKVVFDDGSSIIADAEHQWFTITEKARRSEREQKIKRNGRETTKARGTDQRHKRTYPSIVTTAEIAATLKSQGKNNHQIPVCAPVDYSAKDLPIKPYTLGVWLGDGRTNYGGFCCFDEGIKSKVLADGYTITEQARENHYTIKGIQPVLRQIGVLGNKHIPDTYLLASKEQRMQVLKGLMDTDGHCSKLDNRCEFTSTSKKLADDVLELILSLGFKATMITGRATLNGRDCGEKYRVCFTTDIPVFSLERKFNKQKCGKRAKKPVRAIVDCVPVDSVPVKCIEVDSASHLYLASKAFIATHNSEFVDALLVNLSLNHDWRFAVFSPENQPLQRHAAKIAQKFMGLPFGMGSHTRMNKDDRDIAKYWMQERFFFILPPDDELTIDHILKKAEITVKRYGIRGLVIDPWNELDHSRPAGLSETEYISLSLTKIRRFARTFQVHVWVVAHPVKLQKEVNGNYPVPTPYDISGSAHWRNKADCAIAIWRDVKEEDPLVQVHIQKVRFREVGRVGMAELVYDTVTGRYSDKNFAS